MVSKILAVAAIALESVHAARPFLEYPDTGLAAVVSNITVGSLPALDDMVGLNDFDWAAQNYLPTKNYTYYRNGAGGEWSYRNNLEVYNRYRFIPRQLQDITGIAASLKYVLSLYKIYRMADRFGYLAQPSSAINSTILSSSHPVRRPSMAIPRQS